MQSTSLFVVEVVVAVDVVKQSHDVCKLRCVNMEKFAVNSTKTATLNLQAQASFIVSQSESVMNA